MGMDVIGKNATTERGEYFRNNVWWWRPLWDYCVAVYEPCSKILGHSNDGDGLCAEESLKLRAALLKEIESGRCAAYAKEREEFLNAIPNVKCEVCDGTGWVLPRSKEANEEFMDFVRNLVGMGQVANVNNEELLIETMQKGVDSQIKEPAKCNGCDGKGERRPWDTHYPFSVENVQEFCDFLETCGGFAIC